MAVRMPDIRDRFAIERYVGDEFQQELERQRREYVSIGVTRVADKPESYWEKHKWELAAIALLSLRRPWDAGISLLNANGIALNRRQLDSAYLRWSNRYSQTLADGLVKTAKDAIALVAKKKRSGETLTPEERELLPLSGNARAETIGATETTRAASVAEFSAADIINSDLRNRGFSKLLTAYWHTEQDDRVCKICVPLDGKPHSDWSKDFPFGPPVHVLCRCWIDWR